jgi:hypothetical protein
MASQTWTVKRILEWTRGYLERKGDEHPRLSAEWLISDVTGLSRVQIYMNFDKPLTPAELDAMHDAVVRRGRGEPLQYVTGEMPFRQIVLHCERGVLIPRPETEVLVDAALEGVDAATLTFPAILGNVLEPAEEEAAGDDDKVVSLQGNRSAEKDDAADAQAAELVAPAEPPCAGGARLPRARGWYRYRLHCALHRKRAPRYPRGGNGPLAPGRGTCHAQPRRTWFRACGHRGRGRSGLRRGPGPHGDLLGARL